MYLIDTNVISEQRKGRRADPGVLDFFEEADAENAPLFLSTVTMGELRRGVELKRFRGDQDQCRVLDEWLLSLQRRFACSILPVDGRIAELWGHLRVPYPEHALDKLIAATAMVHSLTVVTRNIRDFSHTGARTLNPFSGDSSGCRISDVSMSRSGLDSASRLHRLDPSTTNPNVRIVHLDGARACHTCQSHLPAARAARRTATRRKTRAAGATGPAPCRSSPQP